MATSVTMDYQNEAQMTWSVKTDGECITKVKEYLLDDGIPSVGIGQIVQSASYTLGFCPDPSSSDSCQRTGIVIGKVQSGKTSNFLAITALAFDNGYNIVIVLGGTKLKLLQQNKERIEEYFERCNDVIVLDTKANRDVMTSTEIRKFIQMGKKIIVVGLKHTKHINNMRASIFSDGILSNEPVLTIDDEGDETSLNTLVKKNKKSATYLAIEQFKESLPKHCFLSITATPQANLLISALDVLSPDFGVLVPAGDGYCGLDEFHRDNSHVVAIPKDETSIIEEGVPDSLLNALAMFFIACSEHKRRGLPAKKVSMLIHPSGVKIDHSSVNRKIDRVLAEWRLLGEDTKDVAYDQLRQRLFSAYETYRNSTCPTLASFETLEPEILDAIKFCKNHVVNSDNGSEVSDKPYDFNIYIGGNMLGRGLTFKGLTITYIIRTSKGTSNVDTVQQRARWFGYRDSYLDLCRVFASEKIINEFRGIRDHEIDLWKTVEEANLQGLHFKDMARVFTLTDGLRMTRSTVAETVTYSFSFWNRQRVFLRDKDISSSNETIIESFRSANKCKSVQYGKGEAYSVLTDAIFLEVKKDLLDKYRFPPKSPFNSSVIGKLATLLSRKSIEAKIDVIWMRYDGLPSVHFIDDNNHIDNYVVGRRPQDKSKPATYEGDDYQFRRPGIMQLQIYKIQDRETGDVSPVIGIYIPAEIINQLTGLVIRA